MENNILKIRYLLILCITFTAMAQNSDYQKDLPYYEVPEYYEEYNAGTVVARMIDGLGFRYRWATEDLRQEDLDFVPSQDARSTGKTIDHILGLSRVILNSAHAVPTDFNVKHPDLSFEEKRIQTLKNFKEASVLFSSVTDLNKHKIQFISSRGESEYPFWNQINGPIADAIWHSGQIASLRRASGNPISSKVSFLQGKMKE